MSSHRPGLRQPPTKSQLLTRFRKLIQDFKEKLQALVAENQTLRLRLQEVEAVEQAHQLKREARRLTQRIRKELDCPAQRARVLMQARQDGMLVSKPNWQELAALNEQLATQASLPPLPTLDWATPRPAMANPTVEAGPEDAPPPFLPISQAPVAQPVEDPSMTQPFVKWQQSGRQPDWRSFQGVDPWTGWLCFSRGKAGCLMAGYILAMGQTYEPTTRQERRLLERAFGQ